MKLLLLFLNFRVAMLFDIASSLGGRSCCGSLLIASLIKPSFRFKLELIIIQQTHFFSLAVTVLRVSRKEGSRVGSDGLAVVLAGLSLSSLSNKVECSTFIIIDAWSARSKIRSLTQFDSNVMMFACGYTVLHGVTVY